MYHFYSNCVGWPTEDVHVPGGLVNLIDDCVDITRRTFLGHVDRDELQDLERQLGYDAHPSVGLTMAGDWHVGYFRSKLHGQTVYGFTYSGIEFVFTQETTNAST